MMVILLGRCQLKSVRIPIPTRTCDFMKRFWLRRDSIHRPSKPSLGSTSSALAARPQVDKFIISPVAEAPNPEQILTDWQDIPSKAKFSEFYDYESCHFVSVGQKKLQAKVRSKSAISGWCWSSHTFVYRPKIIIYSQILIFPLKSTQNFIIDTIKLFDFLTL